MLPYKGTTLVRERVNTIRNAFSSGQLLVVTGAHREAIETVLAGLSCHFVYNPHYKKGLSTSIKAAVSALRRKASAAFFTLVDQPLIGSKQFQQMAALYSEHPGKVIAASYNGIAGVPAIFPAVFFSQLEALDGDKGARKLISSIDECLIELYELPEASVDIDSPEDLIHLAE